MAEVLIVDDEKSIRLTLSEMLRADGFEVESAESAEIALKLLATKPYDVVVTDIIMPRVNGVDLLKAIQMTVPGVQVIMMTGEPTLETASEAIRAGVRDYLAKPVTKEAILRSVRSAVEIKRLNDERRRLADENRRYQQGLEQMVEDRTAELRETNRRLQSTMEGFVLAMARTVESRDPYTAGHEQRVAEIGREIARDMGLSDDVCRGIYMAGLIHDLGKIGVPAEILSKPTRLTETELSLIRIHPEVGHKILEGIVFPWPIADIALKHHERLDGSGYPAGLRGDDIPLEARIIAVADTVEAMISHRPYRPALGLDKALEEIERYSGRLYDERAVKACIALFRERHFRPS